MVGHTWAAELWRCTIRAACSPPDPAVRLADDIKRGHVAIRFAVSTSRKRIRRGRGHASIYDGTASQRRQTTWRSILENIRPMVNGRCRCFSPLTTERTETHHSQRIAASDTVRSPSEGYGESSLCLPGRNDAVAGDGQQQMNWTVRRSPARWGPDFWRPSGLLGARPRSFRWRRRPATTTRSGTTSIRENVPSRRWSPATTAVSSGERNTSG